MSETQAGEVHAICIATGKHGPQQRVDVAELVGGFGIVGDRYFGRASGNPGENLTLVEAEEIERFNRELGADAPLYGTRRNVVTRGIRLVPLIGAEFTIGGVRLRGVEQCEPCSRLGGNLATGRRSLAEVVRFSCVAQASARKFSPAGRSASATPSSSDVIPGEAAQRPRPGTQRL